MVNHATKLHSFFFAVILVLGVSVDWTGLVAGYNVYWKLVNTEDFGIPQHRERVYIVGIRRDLQVNHFQWPMEFKESISLKQLLGDCVPSEKRNLRNMTHDEDGVALNNTVRKNLQQFQDFLDKNPAKQILDFIVDLGT